MKTGKELEREWSNAGFAEIAKLYESGYQQALKDGQTPITKERAREIWAAASSYKWRGFDHWWAEYQKEQEK